ncbi:MAG: hypothetical protein AB7O95_26540 [Geminicoccaceae bacterium]
MNDTLSRRIEQLERDLVPAQPLAPCFVMAADEGEAERKIAQLNGKHGARLPSTLFVMICAGATA